MKVSQQCVGCGQCVAYCLKEAIAVFGQATINDKCIECGICLPCCPVLAILEGE